jgi:hypothetical protein
MKRAIRKRPGLLFVLLVAIAAATVLPGVVRSASATGPPPATLDQVNSIVRGEVSGQNALANVAYVYRGWRNNGGPWFNAALDWLGTSLAGMGFANGQGASGAHYWVQSDYRTGSVWTPQYLSMQITGPDGDADPGNPGAYHFDHPAVNTFDPTSSYYPSYMTQDWVVANIGTPQEAAIQDRCHLATSSAFTSPMNTDLTTAAANAIVADVVDVGTVSTSGTRTWSNHPTKSLAGCILFSQTASMSNLMTLASQQFAKAVMTPMALNDYSHPTIGGVEWYPNNVRFASGGSSAAPTRVSLNISYQDARYLTTLCAQKDVTSEFPQMKLFAIGGTVPYSVAPDTTTMLRTLIVEIPGADPNPAIADQRVVYAAHLQEPGAADNASGVGLQLEMIRAYKHLIDTGALPAPKRTLTFLFGAENTMGTLWKAQNLAAFNSTQIAIDLDMVGEDPAKTGGPMRIEKMPDPSARYKYQLDRLPDDPVPTPTQFLRQPDSHTLWGAGSIAFWPYPGHYFNDVYFAAARRVTADSPQFGVLGNPYEGGSDHTTFLNNKDAAGNWDPKPSVLTWHFTDYVYHSSMDTMDALSGREMHDVGVTSILAGYNTADASIDSAAQTIDVVQSAAHTRFGLEKTNSANHFSWALTHAYGTPASIDGALHEALSGTGNTSSRSIGETQILTEWSNWYKQAVGSARQIFDPALGTDAYTALETAATAAVDADLQDALANAQHLFAVSHFNTASVAVNGGAASTNSRNVVLTLNAGSYAPGGVTGMRFSDDGTTWPASFAVYAGTAAYSLPTGDGAKTVYVQFQDSEGNVSNAVSDAITLDTTSFDTIKPTVTDNAPVTWSKNPVTVTLTPADSGGSGVQKTQYRLQPSTTWVDAPGNQFVVSATANEGLHVYEYQALDNAGNASAMGTCIVRIDTTNPVTTATGLQAANNTGWINGSQSVTLSGADIGGSGVNATYYTLDSVLSTYSGSFAVSGEGSHTIIYWSVDKAVTGGNTEATKTGYVNIDTTIPTVTHNAAATWSKVPVTVTLTPADTGGSGVQKTQYRLQGSSTWLDATVNQFVVDAPADHSFDGAHVYEIQALDNAGNPSATGTCTVRIDTTIPTVTSNAPATWSKSAVTVTLTAADTGGSAVLKTQYRLAGSGTWLDATSNQFSVTAPSDHSNDGVKNYEFQALDNAGSASALGTCTVRIDTTTSVSAALGLQAANNVGWVNGSQNVTLSATDTGGSGVANIYYALDGGTPQTYSAPFAVSGQRSHTIVYWSVDSAVTGGNTEAIKTGYVNIDTTVPTVSDNAPATWSSTAVTVTLTPADTGGSGLQKTQYRLQGSGTWLDAVGNQFAVPAAANDGVHVYQYQALDNAGNASAMGTCTVGIDASGPATTATGLAADGHSGWQTGPANFSLWATDPNSGVSIVSYTIDGGALQLFLGTPVLVSAEGSHAVVYWATDAVGNAEAQHTGYVNIDTIAPVTAGTGLQDSSHEGWTKVSQTVILTTADPGQPSGAGAPVTIYYSLDGGATQTYAAPFGISAAGSHPVAYWSIDAAGNAEAQHTGYINIDTGKPVCKALYDVSVKAGRTATLKCRLSDPAPSCGTATVKITISRRGKVVKRLTFAKHVDTHGPQRYTFKASLKKGAYTWTARATDVAGNVQAKASTKHLTVK